MKIEQVLGWCGAVVVVGGLVLSGCSRSSEPPKPAGSVTVPAPTERVPAAALPPIPAVVTAPPADEPGLSVPEPVEAVSSEEDVPFRVVALMEEAGGAKVGLVDKRSGHGILMKEGETLGGFFLAKVNFKAETALFAKEGREYLLELRGMAEGGDSIPATTMVEGGDEPPSSGAIDLSALQPQAFDPTPEEVEAGIDPNDPDTWPEGYRGPGIERYLKEHPEVMEQQGPTLDRPPEDTAPTEGKGPGIEAALRELEKEKEFEE